MTQISIGPVLCAARCRQHADNLQFTATCSPSRLRSPLPCWVLQHVIYIHLQRFFDPAQPPEHVSSGYIQLTFLPLLHLLQSYFPKRVAVS